MVRRGLYGEVDMSNIDDSLEIEHLDHCIDHIRQGIMVSNPMWKEKPIDRLFSWLAIVLQWCCPIDIRSSIYGWETESCSWGSSQLSWLLRRTEVGAAETDSYGSGFWNCSDRWPTRLGLILILAWGLIILLWPMIRYQDDQTRFS
jgi:hypothetical protein